MWYLLKANKSAPRLHYNLHNYYAVVGWLVQGSRQKGGAYINKCEQLDKQARDCVHIYVLKVISLTNNGHMIDMAKKVRNFSSFAV